MNGASPLQNLGTGGLIALGLIALVQLGLVIAALVSVFRTPDERLRAPRWLWVIIILLGELVGPILYFAIGRKPVTIDQTTPRASRPESTGENVADVLYGAPSQPGAPSGDDTAGVGVSTLVSATAAVALSASGLTKVYGHAKALDGVDLTVPEGSVFGFLGPNGAGKTTTLRILSGLAHATAGSASIFGHDVSSASGEARSLIGYLPDVPGFYDWMTAEEYMRFAGALFGVAEPVLSQRVTALLDLAGLGGITTRVGGFSRGMKQRLGVAQALVNAPRLLMLDEPTSALDPIGRKEVLDMIASLAGRTTVFFSTHILADVERVCDMVAILDQGRVVAEAPIDELKARYAAHRIEIEVDEGAVALAEAVGGAEWVTQTEVRGDSELLLSVADVEAAQRALPALIAERGLALRRFEGGEITLEDVFVDLVSADGTARAR